MFFLKCANKLTPITEMTMRMELAFDFQTVAVFMLMIMVNLMPRAAGLILNTTAPEFCKDSSANINFTVDMEGGTIGSGSEIWYYGTTVIATRPSGVLIPKANYTSRLHSYSVYGLTLDNVTADDVGGYYYEFYFFNPTPEGTKTATASLSVIVPPGDSCIPRYTKSGNEALCELDQTANCGSPKLKPKWTHASGNTFTIENSGTYICCANGSALTNCYKGSSSFCKEFNVTGSGGGGGGGGGRCQDIYNIVAVIGLIIIILGFIIWILLFIKKGDQFLLGLDICSVIEIIGCIISIVAWALNDNQLSLGLGICFGIIMFACIICIIILDFVKNGDFLRLGHCICFAIKIIICIICIVILAKKGEECPQSFLVGFGIGFGILIIFCIIGILILIFFKKVIIQNKDASPSTDEKEVTITAIIYGLCVSDEWFKEKTLLESNEDFTIEPYDNKTRKSSLIIKSLSMKNSATYICRAKNRCGCCSAEDSITLPHDKDKQQAGSSADVSRKDVELQVVESGAKSNDKERPPAVHIGTQNKVESKTTSKQTNDRDKLLPPEDTGVEDTPKIRPQPPPPQNSDIKDRNQRGISATIDNPPGLANETPRLNKLPPLTQKQPIVQEEGAAEEPKKKRKKKKKKDQTNEGNPEEEMVEFEITRTVTIVTKNY